MATAPIPVKTAQGQAELSSRQRGLSQRHRTVLLLVDGRRTEQQVRAMAQQAGANESCFGELLELGLIAVPQPSDVPMSTIPIPRPPVEPQDEPLHVDIPIDEPAPAAQAAVRSDAGADSLLPASRTLQPESVLDDSQLGSSQQPGESMINDFDAVEEASRTQDAALEEARVMLMRAVRREAPLTGSLTMLRLRRARSRHELAELIDEVESRIVKPYRSLAAQQVLRRARHLLAGRVEPESLTA